MESPQIETSNTLTIDFADNPDLREVFARYDVGDKCTIKVELQLMSRYPEGVQCAIEKVISEGGGYEGEDKEAEASEKEPIMMRMRQRGAKNRGMGGPHGTDHGKPPQTAENSNEPWLTSYV